MYGYRLQGLLVASDLRLPGLNKLTEAAGADVEFHLGVFPHGLDVAALQGTEPAYTSPYFGPEGEPFARMWRCPRTGFYYFGFIYNLAFVVDSTGETIWARWSEPVTIEDITAFFLGRILAFVLHLRGHVCLHASAVSVDGRAVLFAGAPGMGKSSTAAAFAERGHPVLTDDVSAIRREADGRIVVVPGIPRLCLWPDSLEFLYGKRAAEQFPLLLPAEDKRVVRLEASPGKFQTEPVPLEAIYLFAPRSSDARAPRIEPVSGGDRLIRLLYNGFMHLALNKEQTARQFQVLGEIAQRVRTRQLVPSSDPRKLGQLCELVLNDLHATNSSLAGNAR